MTDFTEDPMGVLTGFLKLGTPREVLRVFVA